MTHSNKPVPVQRGNAPVQQGQKRDPLRELSAFMKSRRSEIGKVLPAGMTVDRVIKAAIMAAMEDQDILQGCTHLSIYRSVMQCALMGLEVGSGFNEGYFIRYQDVCTFHASYIGWCKVATRSDGIDMLRASLVCANDDLDVVEQPPSVVHKPRWRQGQRGDTVGALACAYTLRKDDQGKRQHDLVDFTFVPIEDLEKARALGGKGWQQWPGEMQKKTAIRRLCKFLPRNNDLARLTRIENNADDGVVDVPDPDALPDTDNLDHMVVDARFEEAANDPEPEPAPAPPPRRAKAKPKPKAAQLPPPPQAEPPQEVEPEPEVIPPAKASRTAALKNRLKGQATRQAPPPQAEPEQAGDDDPYYGEVDQGEIDF